MPIQSLRHCQGLWTHADRETLIKGVYRVHGRYVVTFARSDGNEYAWVIPNNATVGVRYIVRWDEDKNLAITDCSTETTLEGRTMAEVVDLMGYMASPGNT